MEKAVLSQTVKKHVRPENWKGKKGVSGRKPLYQERNKILAVNTLWEKVNNKVQRSKELTLFEQELVLRLLPKTVIPINNPAAQFNFNINLAPQERVKIERTLSTMMQLKDPMLEEEAEEPYDGEQDDGDMEDY